MNELIKITPKAIGETTISAVDGRTLHEFLEVGKKFADWMPEQIETFGFQEHRDFEVCFPNLGSEGRGGQNRKEYMISVPMAKELSMVQRTEKGKQARLYFLECERQAQSIDPMKVLNDPAAMRGLLMTYTEKVLVLQPKADALDRIATYTDGSLCLSDAAKTLQVRPKDLTRWLEENLWIYKRRGSSEWIGYQRVIQSGNLETKVCTIPKRDGSDHVVTQVRLTPKGISRLASEPLTRRPLQSAI